jgi:hypothetical protein
LIACDFWFAKLDVIYKVIGPVPPAIWWNRSIFHCCWLPFLRELHEAEPMERDKAKSRTEAASAPRPERSVGQNGRSRQDSERIGCWLGAAVAVMAWFVKAPGPIKSSARRKARAELALARFPTSQEGLTEAK